MTNASRNMKRVNARLTEDDARKLGYLSKHEAKSVSEVIRAAIQRYYRDTRAGKASASGLIEEFIGCGEAEPDLSTNYKQHLTEYLLRKHGYR
jgi:hypothetical protein